MRTLRCHAMSQAPVAGVYRLENPQIRSAHRVTPGHTAFRQCESSHGPRKFLDLGIEFGEPSPQATAWGSVEAELDSGNAEADEDVTSGYGLGLR